MALSHMLEVNVHEYNHHRTMHNVLDGLVGLNMHIYRPTYMYNQFLPEIHVCLFRNAHAI